MTDNVIQFPVGKVPGANDKQHGSKLIDMSELFLDDVAFPRAEEDIDWDSLNVDTSAFDFLSERELFFALCEDLNVNQKEAMELADKEFPMKDNLGPMRRR